MLEIVRRQIAEALAKRAGLKTELDAVLTAPTAENRGLNEAEVTAFDEKRSAIATLDTEIDGLRKRETDLAEMEKRQAAVDTMSVELGQTRSPARVTSEPETYRQGGKNSYFRDLTYGTLFGHRDAIERLARNDNEVRALTTNDGAIGEFVPPLWLVQDFVKLARAGRVVADQVRHEALPSGTDTINLPRLTSGTVVAEQATQNTAVQDTNAASDSIAANVHTIAGKQVVSLQLLEQSPINLDSILLADLAADYATKIDVFTLNSSATNKKGLLQVSGINAVTYTLEEDTDAAMADLYPKVADAIQRVHTGRFLPAQKILMHPRRWAWMTAQSDSTGRPLVVPSSQMPQNAVADMGAVSSEGFVGSLQGLPVFVDPSIPANLGTGTNEDRIIILRSDDVILYEGSPRAESFREPLADQLSVLLRFYNYAAIHASRYPKSISVISGDGLATPTF